MTIAFITSLIGFIGAFISRLHGGGFFKAPKTAKNILWSAPLAAASFIALYPVMPWQWALGCTTLSFALCLIGKATGHGRVWNAWLPLDPQIKPERLEVLITWLDGRVSDFWYKNIAMALIGFAAVSGAALAIGCVNVWAGLIAASGGFLGKPIAYLIGFGLDDMKGNELAEYITGFCSYFFVALAVLSVLA